MPNRACDHRRVDARDARLLLPDDAHVEPREPDVARRAAPFVGRRAAGLPRKGAPAPTDADDRFDDSRHPRRTLASNGKRKLAAGFRLRVVRLAGFPSSGARLGQTGRVRAAESCLRIAAVLHASGPALQSASRRPASVQTPRCRALRPSAGLGRLDEGSGDDLTLVGGRARARRPEIAFALRRARS